PGCWPLFFPAGAAPARRPQDTAWPPRIEDRRGWNRSKPVGPVRGTPGLARKRGLVLATELAVANSGDLMATRNRTGAPRKMLFIGNSFTTRNDLPGLVAQLAAARGRAIQHRLISAGGASLRQHWNAGEAHQAIHEGKFDHVVLQEQSTLPIK